jgi:hypothetical protein
MAKKSRPSREATTAMGIRLRQIIDDPGTSTADVLQACGLLLKLTLRRRFFGRKKKAKSESETKHPDIGHLISKLEQ